MKYFGKSLLIYSLIFSLMNLSFVTAGDGAVAIGFNQAKAQTAAERRAQAERQQQAQQEQQQSQVTQGLDEVRTKETNFKGDASTLRSTTATFMTLLTMIAIGILASMFVRYKWTTDIGIAVAAGVAYIGGEIYTIFKYKDYSKKEIEKTLSYETRADGTFDDSQIQAFEKQREAYDKAKGTAKTKGMLQLASAVGFGAAGAVALFNHAQILYYGAKCTAGLKATLAAAQGPCNAVCADLTTPDPNCVPGCTTCAGEIAKGDFAATAYLAHIEAPDSPSSLAKYTALKNEEAVGTLLVAEMCEKQNISKGVITAVKGVLVAEAKPSCLSLYKIADANLSMVADLALAENIQNAPGARQVAQFMRIRPSFKERMNQVMNDHGEELLPDHVVVDQLLANGFENFQANQELLFDYSRSIEIEGSELNNYLDAHEKYRLADGHIKSISLDEYESFEMEFSVDNQEHFSFELKKVLNVAANYGIDLLIPKAEAGNFATGLGLTAAVAGILGGLIWSSFKAVDLWMVAPLHRFYVYSAMAVFAGVSYAQTKKVSDQMDDNIDKIDDVIERMRRLAEGKQINTINGERKMIQRRDARAAILAAGPLSSDGSKLDCAVTTQSGQCGSLQAAIVNSRGFGGVGGSIGQVAALSGSVADGFAGQSSVSSGTLNQASQLGGSKAAVQKRIKQEQNKINQLKKTVGGGPINFDAGSKFLAARIRSNAKKFLQSRGISAKSALASMPVVVPRDFQEGKAKPKPVKSSSSNFANFMPSKSGDGGFSFKFDDKKPEEGASVSAADLMQDEDVADQLAQLAAGSEEGIVNNPDASLFNVISVRYLKTGFDRLLELKEEAPAPSESE